VRHGSADSSESVGDDSGKKSTTGQEVSWMAESSNKDSKEGNCVVTWVRQPDVSGTVSCVVEGAPIIGMGLPQPNWGRHSFH